MTVNIIRRWFNRQTASDLRAAANLLEKRGWTQGMYFRPSEGYCVLGAINAVTTGNSSSYLSKSRTNRAVDALYDLLSPKGTLPRYVITDWNDLPNQTAEMVKSTLRAAAERILDAN